MNEIKAVCWGGLAADAATMGFHWLYDQSRIKKAGGDAPEFLDPHAYEELYELNMEQDSFFVHEGKEPGDPTHYGDQLLVALRTLANNNGELKQAEFESEFARHFGPGGQYVGYIDRPTEVVLFNQKNREREAYAEARTFDNGLSETEKGVLEDEVMVAFKYYQKDLSMKENLDILDRWVLIKQDYKRDDAKDEKRIEYCRNMFNVVLGSKNYLCGDVGDDQFPATTKLPAVVSLFHDRKDFSNIVELSVRLTNNNDHAVNYAKVYAAMLAAAIRTKNKDAVLAAGKEAATPEIRDAIDAALNMSSLPNTEVAEFFGLSCHMPYGLPQTSHLIATTDNYVDAVRKNIQAAGDNAGRSVMVGAIFAALYGVGTKNGVPQEWIDKLSKKQEISNLLEKLAT